MTRRGGTRLSARPAAGAKLVSDERLALRAAHGNERAFAAIFERYSQGLYRFCASIVGNQEDAHDALQNTMVKVLQALPGEERHIQLRPWLYRIAHNESVELLRRRRETRPLDPGTAAPEHHGLAETADRRERLRTLLGDLRELPDRQRAALVMRELSGLEFAQIAEAFGTTPAVARQTVYEARLGLRRLAEGREMNCADVMRTLSDEDGRTSRRREIRAHLRSCSECRAFGEAIEARHQDFTALAPLPAVAAAGILHAALAGTANAATAAAGAGAAAGGAAAGTTALAGAGKVAATTVLVKSVATVAVVAAVGTTVADRTGLVDVGLPTGGSDTPGREAPAGDAAEGSRGGPSSAGAAGTKRGSKHRRKKGKGKGKGAAGHGVGRDSAPGRGGAAAGLPPASAHGQETAAEQRANGRSRSKGRGRGSRHTGKGRSSGRRPSHAPGAAKPKSGSGSPPKESSGSGAQSTQDSTQGGTQSAPQPGGGGGSATQSSSGAGPDQETPESSP